MDAADFKWLLIDSCGATATLAVGQAETMMAVRALVGRAFSSEWPGALRELLSEAGWDLPELNVVGVVHGPGSFTGVRVGLAAAKGLCEAAGAQLVAVSRLELMARAAAEPDALAALDGGRGEFYVRAGARECVMGGSELRAAAAQRWVTTADAAVERALEGVAEVERVEMGAGAALPLLLERVVSGRFDDVASIDANYVRGESDIYAPKPRQSGE